MSTDRVAAPSGGGDTLDEGPSSSCSGNRASWSSDFGVGALVPPTSSEKSLPFIENRIGGRAGAMKVACDMRSSAGEISSTSEFSPLPLVSVCFFSSSGDLMPVSLSASVSVPLSTLRGTSALRAGEFGRDLVVELDRLSIMSADDLDRLRP